MLNLDYLRSGIQVNYNKFNVNYINNINKLNNKKIEYYRLSSGFKDANNNFLKSKNN